MIGRGCLMCLYFCFLGVGVLLAVELPVDGEIAEEWAEVFIDGEKVGYSYSLLRRENDVVFTETKLRHTIKRGPIVLEMGADNATRETIDGKPLEFSYTLITANVPLRYEGRFEGNRVTVRSMQSGISQEWVYDIAGKPVMTWGSLLLAETEGFDEGVRYTMPLYSPELRMDSVVPTEVEVFGREVIEVGTGKQEARKMVSRTRVPGAGSGAIETVSWVDEDGKMVKTEVEMGGMRLTMLRSTEEAALAEYVPADIFTSTLLQLNEPIGDENRVRFEIKFKVKPEEPVKWDSSSLQRIVETSDDRVLLEVRSEESLGRWGKGGGMVESRRAAFEPYLGANAFINPDDPEIVELARKMTGRSVNVWEVVSRLRESTSDYLETKGLQTGFATSTEVVREKSGDCTEFAVLLAALARAKGIPSRVVVGLAYVDHFMGQENTMGFHMWTQVWINGNWIDVDAALKETQCTARRIAFAASGLNEDTLAGLSLQMNDLLGQLEVQVVD